MDLIVLGTHGRTGLGKLVMGSIAEEIFWQAPCPVLTIGPRVQSAASVLELRHDRSTPPSQIRFHHVLCATDLRRVPAVQVAHAVSLAREFRARLTLLHVMDGYDEHLHEHPGPIDNVLRELSQLVDDDAGLHYEPQVMAEFGTPAESILETAASHNADLIVLGLHSATGHMTAATHFGGSTAHRVVVGAHCPVLTVRG
jgi:nucleotide-binding universal stress UspA family protein